jgi:hypothetical protein
MARDPILWLAATVRVLQRKVDCLEKVHAFQLNPKAPEFISRRMKDEEFAEHLMIVLHSHSTMPTKPPGVHAPVTSSAPATTYAALSANLVEGSGPTKLPKMDPSVIELMKLLPAIEADIKLLDDANQRAEAVLRDWKFPAEKFVEPEISFEYWKFSEETCVDLSDSDSVSDSEDEYLYDEDDMDPDSEFEDGMDPDDYAQLAEFYAMQHLDDEFDEVAFEDRFGFTIPIVAPEM